MDATSHDELDIMQVIHRYGLAIDGGRWDLFDELFTPDIAADYGDPMIFHDRESFKQGARAVWGSFDATQHSMSNIVWDLRGDSARTLTYGGWCLIRRGTPGGDAWEGRGWYDDELVRTDEGWQIRRRCCRVMSWTGNAAAIVPAGEQPPEIELSSLKASVQAGTVGFFRP